MAAQKQTVATDRNAQIASIMAQLRAPQRSGALLDRVTDGIADSGEGLARIGASFGAATDNMSDAFNTERERQLKRRAEKLLALAEAA